MKKISNIRRNEPSEKLSEILLIFVVKTDSAQSTAKIC